MKAIIDSMKNIVDVYWEDDNMFFGHIYLFTNGLNDKVQIDSEYMGKDFVKKVLCQLVDDAELTS